MKHSFCSKPIIHIMATLLLFLLPACTNRVPEDAMISQSESYVFPGDSFIVSHGSFSWPEDSLVQKETMLPVDIASQFRLCKNFDDYQAYQNLILRLFPDAKGTPFPDIPAEWFDAHSLVTLFHVSSPGSASDVTLLDRHSIGNGLYFFLEGWHVTGLSSTPDTKKEIVTLMIPMDKADTKGIRNIGYIAEPSIDADTDSEFDWWMRKREEHIASIKKTLDTKAEVEEIETSYRRAVAELPGGNPDEATLTYTSEKGIVSDGNYEDTAFHIKFYLYPPDGTFPQEAASIQNLADYYAYLYGPYREWMAEYDLPGWYYDWGMLVPLAEMEDYYVSNDAFTGHGSILVTLPELREILADDRVAYVYLTDDLIF
ncbi:MAG: hypothetical protein IJB51_13805 [Clostridia bacterium]|nr:hypothetical protein [Clostridia bacterium]